VSFDLHRGERLAIVGESGSGKSALALSLMRLIQPPGEIAGGEIWLDGRELLGMPERAMGSVRGRQIALVLQDPMSALDPVKTIGSQICEALRQHDRGGPRREQKRRAIALLREVEVPHAERRVDDYPHQYSGGMRQRVLLAIALANDPTVLICDEPTTALDVTTQAQVLDLLDKLVAEHNTAVILITHNLGIVADFCDRVLVMYAGRIVEQATVRQIYSRPVHPYTEALLNAIPRPDRVERGPLPAIPGIPPDLSSLGEGCSFQPRCPMAQDVCLTSPPPAIPWDGADPGFAECHFVEERLGQAPMTA
jgi:oligopeptide/dipeptide ABC transporter ATP-binding protein